MAPPEGEKIGGWLEKAETESIFAPPEPSDDLFGAAPAGPFVEFPPERPRVHVSHTFPTTPAEAPAADAKTVPDLTFETVRPQEPSWAQTHPDSATALIPQSAPAAHLQEDNLEALGTPRAHKRS